MNPALALALALAACSPELPLVSSGPPVEQLELRAGGIVLHAAGAWVEDDGDGRAEAVRVEAPPLVIEGERSSWSLADQVVRFEGGVVATRGPTRLEAERLEVRYRGERVVSALAEGSVVVRREARRAEARAAALDVDSGRLVMTGQPTLYEGPHRLTGEQIVLFLDEDRAECTGCTMVVAGEAVAPARAP